LILEELVHLSHLGRDTEIDGPVTNLDDKSTADVRVDLGHNLELLALANVLRLRDGGFETGKGAVIKRLANHQLYQTRKPPKDMA
jgi:hypothetical protein